MWKKSRSGGRRGELGLLQHREPGNPTAGWAQPVIFHDAAAIKSTTTVGYWSDSDLAGKTRRMELNVVTEADEASSTKVNFNEGSDEDALEVRGGTAHFDITWSKRPRPTRLVGPRPLAATSNATRTGTLFPRSRYTPFDSQFGVVTRSQRVPRSSSSAIRPKPLSQIFFRPFFGALRFALGA